MRAFRRPSNGCGSRSERNSRPLKEMTVNDPRYAIADTSSILSPGLVIFRDLVEQNLDEMVRVAGSASRLRPHCKTHKMREIALMPLARGIVKPKGDDDRRGGNAGRGRSQGHFSGLQ